MIKCTLALIFIALLAANTQALEIPEVQFGVGYTCTEKPPNTLWHQDEFKNSIKNCDTGYQIGLRFKPTDNIYITTGYKYLGKFSVDADIIANDYTYFDWQKGGKAPPLSHLTGSGKAHGIYFKGEYHFKHLFLIGGAWAHKTEWNVSSPAEMKMWRYGPNKGQIHGPYNVQHKGEDDVSFSWIAGVGYKFGRVSILAEVWNTKDSSGIYPTYIGKSPSLSVVYTLK